MDIIIPEIIKENPLTMSIALILTLIGIIIKAVKGLIDFYEEVILKRYFNRLNSLKENVKLDSTTYNYINALQENEIFRLASGIKSSPEKNNILMEIYLLGIVSNSDLKRISRYLKPDTKKIVVDVDWFDKLQFTYSFLAGAFLFLYGFIVAVFYFMIGEGIKMFSGVLTMFIFTFMTVIIGRDYKTFRILKRVKELLVKHDMLVNPYGSIQWDFVSWFKR